MFSPGDSLGFTAKAEYELAVHALGGLTWFLTDSQLDLELLSMRHFEEYIPSDRAAEAGSQVQKSKAPSFVTGRHHMVRALKTYNHKTMLCNLEVEDYKFSIFRVYVNRNLGLLIKSYKSIEVQMNRC